MPDGRPSASYPPGVIEVAPSESARDAPPEAFAAALAHLRSVLDAPVRPELSLRIVPAPKRMAPWSVAVAAEVRGEGDETVDIASGRFVVLHDPQGQDGWRGDTRIVAFVEAAVDPEMGADPALADAGWSWLLDGLAERAAGCTATSGTVTRTASRRFGEMEDPADECEVEVRASWTPLPGRHGIALGDHLLAWCDLLCSTAGLPPVGVTALHRP